MFRHITLHRAGRCLCVSSLFPPTPSTFRHETLLFRHSLHSGGAPCVGVSVFYAPCQPSSGCDFAGVWGSTHDLVFQWQLSAGSTLLAWLPFMRGGGVCWIAPPLFLLLLRLRGRAFPGARFLFRFPDPGRSPAPRAGRGRRGCLRRLALLN